MKKHQYKVTVDYVADAAGNAKNQTLQFDAPNHDDIFNIVEMTQQREGFTPEMAQRFVVGLKLMGEVMLENKDHPLFQQLRPFMMDMMKVIKGQKA